MKLNILLWSFAVSFMACGLKPSADPGNGTGLAQVRFNFAADSLGLFANEAQSVDIAIFADADGKKGSEISRTSFAIKEDNRYLLSGVTIGPKWFVVDLKGAGGRLLAAGELRYVVTIGSQSIDEIVLLPVQNEELPLNLALQVNLIGFEQGDETALDFAASARAVLEAGSYGCTSCHSSQGKLGGLDMESFPYVSNRLDSLAEIVQTIAKRVVDTERPMPPSQPFLTAAEAAQVTGWGRQLAGETGGTSSSETLSATVTTSDQIFELVASGANTFSLAADAEMVVTPGETLEFQLEVSLGEARLLSKQYKSQVKADGQLELTVDINYEEPVIEVPIVVGG